MRDHQNALNVYSNAVSTQPSLWRRSTNDASTNTGSPGASQSNASKQTLKQIIIQFCTATKIKTTTASTTTEKDEDEEEYEEEDEGEEEDEEDGKECSFDYIPFVDERRFDVFLTFVRGK